MGYAQTVANLLSSSSATPLRKTEQSKININLTNQAQRTGTGVVLVVGKNFGTGFPQEQVATALRNAGIPLVMSASVERIFERDAIVNGPICLESFKLVSFFDQEIQCLEAGIVNIPNPSGQILSKLAIFHLQVSTNQYFCPSSPAQETKVSMEVWVDEIKLHWAADNKKHGCLRRDLSRELKWSSSNPLWGPIYSLSCFALELTNKVSDKVVVKILSPEVGVTSGGFDFGDTFFD
ncbi:hypothetical protein PSTG_10511 [Puccinia striiformis f. sp. tritici PST-78]|uniref:Aconitase A/isopropylmalate dehydratase small subunit swivel domain-containing protein n=1 Tax=Puccinia striiformis f. sp. tritici PST-78 TaxID=1165861 RepID=A0A0L0VB72_9BASI|nr:hypothetical protein PSTG_10511 [Puccinia striiformis f. sp. tritici PST-78]